MAEVDPYNIDEDLLDDSDEEFEDAYDLPPMSEDMDMETAINETIATMHLFLNNKFQEAKAKMEPWADRSFYHSLGYGTIMFLQACMTFEAADIHRGVEAVKRSIAVSNRYRKKSSLLGLGKVNYNKMTREELHAEVCYAEALIQRALLLFVQDENLINFVKGALKIRSCYNSYKECVRILEKREFKKDDAKIHFESGVNFGCGVFNLMISLLPTRIMKLLEFAGFSGKKKKGLDLLESASRMPTALRGPICSIYLLGYHTVIVYVLGTADGDMKLCDEILKSSLQKYPKGAVFLFFAGRVEEIKGNIPQAIKRFEEAIEAQSEWRQFHHLNYWELMWCHSFLGEWLFAMKYAEKLCNESRWSKATYTYQKAVFLLMCDDQSEKTKKHVSLLFKEVPKLKQRIAGKSLPFEKFAMKKAKRYSDQGDRLVAPAYELIYMWNGFALIGKVTKYLEPVLANVEAELKKLEANKKDSMFYEDDVGLCLLLKGTCLWHIGKLAEAEKVLLQLYGMQENIKEDTYLLPFALVELGYLNIRKGEYNAAINYLDRAKTHQKYSMESRLHFRIHAAKTELEYAMGKHDDDDTTLADLDESTAKVKSDNTAL